MLQVNELASWRKRLPGSTPYPAVKALRQVLNYAVACRYAPENIAKRVRNPMTVIRWTRMLASASSCSRQRRESLPSRAPRGDVGHLSDTAEP